jgi:hypothetical protein
MRLLPQLLRLCFWALPLQRLCVVAGGSLMLAILLVVVPSLDLAVYDPKEVARWARVLEWGILGAIIFFLPAMFTGGPMWRALSAQRAVALAPRARAKLLAAAFLMVVQGSLAIAIFNSALYVPWQWKVVPYSAHINNGWVLFVSYFQLATWWAIASFFAARSLLATFTVLLVLVAGSLATVLFDLPLPEDLGRGFAMTQTLLLWGVFAAWYLRARRIAPPVWTSRKTDDVALVTQADTGGIAAGVSRRVALERLLLGGRSTSRILLQWLGALALLQAMLLGVRSIARVEAQLVSPTRFFVLLLVLPAVAAISWLLASRLRHVWLSSGCSRAELFALGERQLLILAAGLSAICAGFFVWLWAATPSLPDVSLAFGLCSLLGGVLLPVYAALLHGNAGAAAASFVIVIVLMQTYLRVFVAGEASASWWWLALLPVATVALRQLARRRWLDQDMPRAASAPAS